MAPRRAQGWADVPTMETPYPNERELLGLAAVVAILNKLSAEERGRVLRYVADRFDLVVAVAAEVVVDEPPRTTPNPRTGP